MGRREKKFNKRLIGAVIGGAVLSVGGLSLTPKGKTLRKRLFCKVKNRMEFLKEGCKELKDTATKK